ncbi:nucleotidyltransferase family protein [Leptolyngbya iicbica]|uniref:nucleotidyltransferase family protein n=1 Tax=Leptolyngbya iicbica TaxID=3161580 RepID=UPI001F1951EC|nr:nucleotidyltransferase domain-containing protein [Leptolyngbya sp. LK]
MELHAIINLLQKHHATLADFGVESLAMFGSVVRDEAQDSSDLDVLVEFKGQATFLIATWISSSTLKIYSAYPLMWRRRKCFATKFKQQ